MNKTVDNKTSVLHLLSDALPSNDNVMEFYELNHNIPVCQLLHDIRKTVWHHFRNCCRSLSAMDCNAQFSKIFQTKNFGIDSMSFFEQEIFLTKLYHYLCKLKCTIK